MQKETQRWKQKNPDKRYGSGDCTDELEYIP